MRWNTLECSVELIKLTMVLEDIQSFAPLGTKLFFHENSSRKNSIVLTPNMATLSRGCKPRIGVLRKPLLIGYCFVVCVLFTVFPIFCSTSFNFFLAFRSRGDSVKRCDKGKQRGVGSG